MRNCTCPASSTACNSTSEHDVPGQSVQLIAPLDATGQSQHCRALPPKQRVIDLREGDWIRHKGNVHRIVSVRAYREAVVRDGAAVGEGYVVRA